MWFYHLVFFTFTDKFTPRSVMGPGYCPPINCASLFHCQSRFDAAVLVSLHSPVDPQTPNMTPRVYKSSDGDIPYMYVDNAKQNADGAMLFRCVVTMLRVFINNTRSGDDSEIMGKRVAAALDQARKLQVRTQSMFHASGCD